MIDIIVTTPKKEMKNAALEAEELIKEGGGYYFRSLHSKPSGISDGSRIFYVEDGYVRGFCFISELEDAAGFCELTGRYWKGRCKVLMYADSWKWIKPIPMKGFQGWRYYLAPKNLEIVGNWLDPRPEVQEE